MGEKLRIAEKGRTSEEVETLRLVGEALDAIDTKAALRVIDWAKAYFSDKRRKERGGQAEERDDGR